MEIILMSLFIAIAMILIAKFILGDNDNDDNDDIDDGMYDCLMMN